MVQKIKDWVQVLRQGSGKELFRQWREHYDLPPKEVKADLPRRRGNLYQQWVKEGSLAPGDMSQEPVHDSTAPKNADLTLVKKLVRYIIIEGAIIMALIIALAVVTTMLAIKAG